MDDSANAWTDCCRCCLMTSADQQHQQLRALCSDFDDLDTNTYISYSTYLDAIIAHDSDEQLEDTAIDDEYTPPPSICNECLNDLRNAMAFSELCRRSHRVLRERWLDRRQRLIMKYEVLEDAADEDIDEELFVERLDVDNELLDDETRADHDADAFENAADASSVYEATQWLLDEKDDANESGSVIIGNVLDSADDYIATDEANAAVASGTWPDQPHQGSGIQITFACNGCKVEFNSEALLQKHFIWCDNSRMRDAHPITSTAEDADAAGDGGAALKVGNMFQCDYCGKWHSSKRALVLHMHNLHMSQPHKAE